MDQTTVEMENYFMKTKALSIIKNALLFIAFIVTSFICISCGDNSVESNLDVIPYVKGVQADYDTLNGVVSLRWNRPDRSSSDKFIIYRQPDSIKEFRQIAYAVLSDTFYVDTVFNYKTRFNDSESRVYQYRVGILDENENCGPITNVLRVYAVLPRMVRTSSQLTFLTNVAPNSEDTVLIRITLENTVRCLKYLKWIINSLNDTAKIVQCNTGCTNIIDTLKYSFHSEGSFTVVALSEDNAGTVWIDSIRLTVVDVQPTVKAGSRADGILLTIDGFGGQGNLIVYRSSDSTWSDEDSVATISSAVFIDTVDDSNKYSYSVATLRNGRTGNRSKYLENCSASRIVPDAPVKVTAHFDSVDGKIPLQWKPSLGATKYIVLRGLTSVNYENTYWKPISTISDTVFVDTVSSDTIYSYRIKASNVIGSSIMSDIVDAFSKQSSVPDYQPIPIQDLFGRLCWRLEPKYPYPVAFAVFRKDPGDTSFVQISPRNNIDIMSLFKGYVFFYDTSPHPEKSPSKYLYAIKLLNSRGYGELSSDVEYSYY